MYIFEFFSEEDMQDLYFVKVKFYSNSIRKKPPCIDRGRYSPHLVVEGDIEYLGVTFVDGNISVFDNETDAIVVAPYDAVGYHKLVKDAKFLIKEGPHTVGEGIVEDIYKDAL